MMMLEQWPMLACSSNDLIRYGFVLTTGIDVTIESSNETVIQLNESENESLVNS